MTTENKKDLSPSDGGCWFCYKDSCDMYDCEWDTNLHIECLYQTLQKDPDNPEANCMKYILERPHWLCESEMKDLGEPEEKQEALLRYQNKWYFINEIQTEIHGPYAERTEAVSALKVYAASL